MKFFLLIVLGFAIFAATLAATSKNKTRNVDNRKEKTKSDFGIQEDIEDILQDDDDDDIDDQVKIPTPGKIASIDPITLARKIKKVGDPKTRKELIRELKKASNRNKNSPAGTFYRAAYAALLNENRTRQFRNKQIGENASKILASISNPIGNDLLRKTGSGFGISDVFGNVQKLAEADPVGKLLQRGESGVLRGLSNGVKTFGSVSDSFHDGVGNMSKIVRALTLPVDAIPVAKDVKNGVHNLIEGQAERNKYLAGTFADNTVSALQNAADDANQQADEKEKKLRRLTA